MKPPRTAAPAQGSASPGAERSGAGGCRTPVSRACRAPRWHLLATTWGWACSSLTPATVPSESENYKAIICAAIGILFFRSEGINETQGQWERIPKAQRQQVSGGAAREGPQCQERASLTGRCLAVPQLRRAAGCTQGSPDTHPSLPNQPSPSRLQTVTSSGGTGMW